MDLTSSSKSPSLRRILAAGEPIPGTPLQPQGTLPTRLDDRSQLLGPG